MREVECASRADVPDEMRQLEADPSFAAWKRAVDLFFDGGSRLWDTFRLHQEPGVRPPSRLRRFVFACIAMALSATCCLAALFAVDLYAHRRAERTAGLNIWGYRGPTVGAKAPGEVRIVFLGGSTMFGYGVVAGEAIPAVVERELRAQAGVAPVSGVNLGYNAEGAYSFAFTLRDFAHLDYDVAVLYEGYNDMMGDPTAPNTAVFRHESAVFRLTGYYPILPLALREKAMSLRFGGNLDAAYAEARGEGKTVFTPTVGQRTSAAALETALRVSESIGQQLGRLTDAPSRTITAADGRCPYPWAEYCESVHLAVAEARSRGTRVAVVTQPGLFPPMRERHVAQQDALRAMLRRDFAEDAGVTYVDLSGAVDLQDPALCYDGMHLTAAGNQQAGAALARALVPIVHAARASQR